MNIDKLMILREVKKSNQSTQRTLASACDLSLGKTNKVLNDLISDGFIINEKSDYFLTDKANDILEQYRVDNAIIMAAGFGSRFVPLSYETPKGLLEVYGERMIERQIKQLLEVSITDITVVVGYLKEKFEYLIDKYNVKLVYNPDFATKNNLSTIYHVRHLLKNTYILSSDNYMTKNLYNTYEFKSWYSVVESEGNTAEWCVKSDKKGKITNIQVGGVNEWYMYGSVFFSKSFSEKLVPLVEETYSQSGSDNFYWEDVMKIHLDKLEMYVNCQSDNTVYEFENLEELREFDPAYKTNSNNKVLSLIAKTFGVQEVAISDIKPLKLGMTNKSFIFQVGGTNYICRIPGEGTEELINREAEYLSYQAVIPLDVTEKVILLDPESGVKISEFESNARALSVDDKDELRRAIEIIKKVHLSGITVEHSFDIEEQILFYEGLCNSLDAILFEDYLAARSKMNELLELLRKMDIPKAFSHIDPNCDNFLVLPDENIRLIDWEYSGMCDPVIDISMLAIYSYFDDQQLDEIMIYYFEGEPTTNEKVRVYSYVALGGFLWALWAVYKQALGVAFGEYTLRMYRYAKVYYNKVMELIAEEEEINVG